MALRPVIATSLVLLSMALLYCPCEASTTSNAPSTSSAPTTSGTTTAGGGVTTTAGGATTTADGATTTAGGTTTQGNSAPAGTWSVVVLFASCLMAYLLHL